MWLQALQSNFQQAPSSFDCQEPKPSPWNIITIITVISLYQGCWPSNRSVEPHTYLAISAHIEHNPGAFPSARCLPSLYSHIANWWCSTTFDIAASALVGMHQVISQGIAHEDHLFFEVAGVLSHWCEAEIIPTGWFSKENRQEIMIFPPEIKIR